MKPSMRLHHGAISVKDMQQSVTFYQDVFGFEVDTETVVNDGFKITHLKLGDSYIELFWLKEHQELPEHAKTLDTDLAVIGVKHMAFVTDNAERMYEQLRLKNVEMIGEVRADNPEYKYFFFKDINGILFEFVQHK